MEIINDTGDEITFKTDDKSKTVVGIVILVLIGLPTVFTGIIAIAALIMTPDKALPFFLGFGFLLFVCYIGWSLFDHPTTFVTLRKNHSLVIERIHHFNRRETESFPVYQIDSLKLFEVDLDGISHIVTIVFHPKSGITNLRIEDFGYLHEEERNIAEQKIEKLNKFLKPEQ